MSRRTFVLVVALLVVAGAGAALTLFLVRREHPYDPDFDTRVERPAHRGEGGPLVLYDEAHLNAHTADSAYRPFVELVRSDGFEVGVVREPFTADLLAPAAVLVVVAPRGGNETNDAPAFTAPEIAALHDWVAGGGALLLVTDHWPFGAAAESLGRAFGVEMGKGLVEDPGHEVIAEVVDGLGPVVEGGNRRYHHCTHPRQGEQVLQVDLAQWCLARYEDQAPPFLERDVGGSSDQPVGVPGADTGDGLHAARSDDHAVGRVRAGGDGGCLVAGAVHDVGELGHLPRAVGGLQLDGRPGPAGEHQMGLHTVETV